jgi:hypothetical protein
MADSLYLLTLHMTANVSKLLNEEKKMVETASYFVSICYAPWFLKSCIGYKASANDLAAFKTGFILSKFYPKLAQSLLSSMQRHTWYLTQELVLFSLADDDVEENEKKKMLCKLIEQPVPEEFNMGKPELPVVTSSTELCDLVGPQSWLLLRIAGIPTGEVEKWIDGGANQSLDVFKNFVRNIECTNDCAERNIKLIQDFVSGYRNEDMKQNLMLVARDNRKKLKKTMTKEELKNV